MKRKVKAVLASIVLLVSFLTVQMIIPVIIGAYYGISSNISEKVIESQVVRYSSISQLSFIMMQILGVFFLLAVFKIKKTKIKEYIDIKKVKTDRILIYLAYGVAFQLVAMLGNAIVSQFYDLEKSTEVINNIIKSENIFLSVFIVIILAPLVEELLFRGMILNKLNNHLSQKVTIVIQSVLFSLFHFNLAQLIPTFLLGLFLGFCYFKFKNLWAVILIHFSFNTFGFLVDYIPGNIYFLMYLIPVVTALMSVNLTQKHATFNK